MSDPTQPPEGSEPQQPVPPPPPPPATPDYGQMPPAPPPPPPPGNAQPAAGGAGTPPLSVSVAFNWGWAKFQQNAGVIIIATLIYFVIIVAVEVVWYVAARSVLPDNALVCTTNPETHSVSCNGGGGLLASLLLSAVGSFAIFVLIAFLQAGIIRGAIAIANGQRLELPVLFKTDHLGQVILGALIVGIAASLGLFLCLVGALVVWFFTSFWLFFVIDQDKGAWDAIVASIQLVNANIATVVVLLIGVILAYVIGAILCGIGLIVTAPVALLALTYAYRRLQSQPVAA